MSVATAVLCVTCVLNSMVQLHVNYTFSGNLKGQGFRSWRGGGARIKTPGKWEWKGYPLHRQLKGLGERCELPQ